jgi:hypothetical protein
MSKNLLLTAGVLFLSSLGNFILATPIPPNPTVTPIDGGVSLLLAACAGYGAKKIYDFRKSKRAIEKK